MYDLEPSEFYLGQNYPNPFSEKTIIKYCIAYKTKVRLEIFNPDGERIKTLLDEEKEAGTYEVEFKPSTNLVNGQLGNRQPCNETYLYKFVAGNYVATKKMIYLRQQ
jgi:hypothetical protein